MFHADFITNVQLSFTAKELKNHLTLREVSKRIMTPLKQNITKLPCDAI